MAAGSAGAGAGAGAADYDAPPMQARLCSEREKDTDHDAPRQDQKRSRSSTSEVSATAVAGAVAGAAGAGSMTASATLSVGSSISSDFLKEILPGQPELADRIFTLLLTPLTDDESARKIFSNRANLDDLRTFFTAISDPVELGSFQSEEFIRDKETNRFDRKHEFFIENYIYLRKTFKIRPRSKKQGLELIGVQEQKITVSINLARIGLAAAFTVEIPVGAPADNAFTYQHGRMVAFILGHPVVTRISSTFTNATAGFQCFMNEIKTLLNEANEQYEIQKAAAVINAAASAAGADASAAIEPLPPAPVSVPTVAVAAGAGASAAIDPLVAPEPVHAAVQSMGAGVFSGLDLTGLPAASPSSLRGSPALALQNNEIPSSQTPSEGELAAEALWALR